MKVQVRDYKPIIIPPKLGLLETGAFTAETPYVAKLCTRLQIRGYREGKLPYKILCLESLWRRMEELGGYSGFSEPLAGVGLSARIFDSPSISLYLNELDKHCYKVLRKNFNEFGVTITNNNALEMRLPEVDVTFLDFNDFTFTRAALGPYEALLQRAFFASKKFVILNDCSIFYFRYGERSFKTYSRQLRENIYDVQDYFKAAARHWCSTPAGKGWRLAEVAWFRDSSFQLYYKGAPGKTRFTQVELPKEPFIKVTQ